MKQLLATIACLCLLPVIGNATTTNLDINLTFDVERVTSTCYREDGLDCTPIGLGGPYPGAISWTGVFEEIGGGLFSMRSGTATCSFGNSGCLIGKPSLVSPYWNSYSALGINFLLTDFQGFQLIINFDLVAGTGTYIYEDDGDPVSIKLGYEMTNVVASGFPSPVPLPAGGALLLTGLFGLGAASRRLKRK